MVLTRKDCRAALLAALGVSYLTYAYWIGGRASPPSLSLCPFLNLTGIPCPLCGVTRSFGAMLHGQLGRAVGYNRLGPALLLSALAFAGYRLSRAVRWIVA